MQVLDCGESTRTEVNHNALESCKRRVLDREIFVAYHRHGILNKILEKTTPHRRWSELDFLTIANQYLAVLAYLAFLYHSTVGTASSSYLCN